jgi:beta-phosphoglucomutase family hydrolase
MTLTACLFDLDGVLTKTQTLHAEAWRDVFDPFLADLGLAPFAARDYERYVDGKRREDGIRSFLASRGIALSADGVRELAERKNELALELMDRRGVEPYEDAVRLVHAVREAGLRTAVVSSSSNARAVLRAAGIDELFDACVDARSGLPGKPAPDFFLAAADAVGAVPATAAVFEDALAGVAAGRAGGFALVVAVDRAGQAAALREAGADVVVRELTELAPYFSPMSRGGAHGKVGGWPSSRRQRRSGRPKPSRRESSTR